MPRNKIVRQIAFLFIYATGSLTVWGQTSFSPDHPGWRFTGDAEKVEQFAGRSAIKITRGKAFLDEVDFENGMVEFDIYTSGERAFVYFLFRGESDVEFEEIYIRPHKSSLPDALQYAPVFQSRSAWQLYHGETGTAPARIPSNEWVTVRLELMGSRAKIWVGEGSEPVLVIDELGRKPGSGWIAFRGFAPPTSPAEYTAYFGSLRITATESGQAATPGNTSLPSGQITRWRVSPAFEATAGPIIDIPPAIDESTWTTPKMQKNGVFEFLRSRKIPEGVRHYAVVADVTLRAKEAQTCAVHMGFSDDLTLSVNGQLLLYQDANYRFEKPRQDGVMHPDQVIAYLPLKKGDNHVRAVVADSFGGWGFSARMQDCQGVESR